MLNNWRYVLLSVTFCNYYCRFFFPANILSHMDEMDEPIENENEFTAIMMVRSVVITMVTDYVGQ